MNPKQIDALDIPCVAITSNGQESETTIAKALDNQLAKEQQRAAAERLSDRQVEIWVGVGNLAKQWKEQLDRNQTRRRIRSIVKAQLRRQNVAAMEAETAGMLAKVEALNLAKAESEQALATAREDQIRLTAQQDQLGARLNHIISQLNAGQERVERAQEDAAARIAARRDDDRASWSFKASTTSDPILRSAWLAKANGENCDDDD
jgi:(p)ppGpp synthase/HD superfamily hydrolase